MSDRMAELNPSQKEAILHTDGPVMILAGAGSGKTRTLVSRISYLIEEKRISPSRILALTFSNKAAKEMRERIASMISYDANALQMTTFHAFCSRLLRSEANYLGLSRNFTIYDTSESKSIVKTLLNRHGISPKEVNPYDVLHFIDSVKNIGYYDGREDKSEFDIDFSDPFYKYYEEYELELHKANAVDFGGLIVGVLKLFALFPEVLKRYQDRFEYVLIDEYQDTNRAQFELMKLLCESKRNVCVVGDEDQSIYSWRGADIKNILDMEEFFPEVKIIKLEQNYRSSSTIIEAATSVISRNSLRKGKSMWTENPDGELVTIVENADDRKESQFVADKIVELKQAGSPYFDMAVFYRTNSQSRMIEDALRLKNIPYRVVGGVKFYERKEIKDILAYARLAVNPKDSLALSRIINVPARGIGATSLRKLEDEAVRQNSSLLETMSHLSDNPEDYSHIRLNAKIKNSLKQLIELIQDLQILEEKKTPPSFLFEKILHETGYWDFLKATKDYESLARLDNLKELGSAIKQFEESVPDATLTLFLESITLDQTNEEVSQENSEAGEVSLMTVHGAKGLEFPYVFVTGVEENVFPSYRALDEGEYGEEEERRLFYVAMTRAMKKLWITFACGRMLFGQIKFNGPSRYLNEINPKCVEWTRTEGFRSQNYQAKPDWEDDYSQESQGYDEVPVYQVRAPATVKTEKKSEKQARYPKGSRVSHSLYGEGTVLDTTGFGTDEIVTIKFSDGAKKKFAVKYAPLSELSH